MARPRKIWIHLEQNVVATSFMFQWLYRKTKAKTFLHLKRSHMSFPFWADRSRHLWDDPPLSMTPQLHGVTSCFHLCSSQLLLPAFHVPGCQKSTILLGGVIGIHLPCGDESTILHPSMGCFANVYSSHLIHAMG